MTCCKHERLTAEERRALKLAESILDELAKLDPSMSVQRAKVLLMIFQEDGLSNDDISRRAGIEQSKVSRDVQSLSAQNRQLQPGLGLVEEVRDAVNRRIFRRYVTDVGKQQRTWLISRVRQLQAARDQTTIL